MSFSWINSEQYLTGDKAIGSDDVLYFCMRDLPLLIDWVDEEDNTPFKPIEGVPTVKGWVDDIRYNLGRFVTGSDENIYRCIRILPVSSDWVNSGDNTPYKPITGVPTAKEWVNQTRYFTNRYVQGTDGNCYRCKLSLPTAATTDNSSYRPVTGTSWTTYWEIVPSWEYFWTLEELTWESFWEAAHIFSSGDGTENDPYHITNREDLEGIGHYLKDGTYFLQKDDIDLSSTEWEALGSCPYNSLAFIGHYNGNNFEISGLSINKYSGDDNYPDNYNMGLFSSARFEVSFKNIKLVDVNIKGDSNVGALVGNITSNNWGNYTGPLDCLIENCHSSGSVEGDRGIGGLIGNANFFGDHSSILIKDSSSSCQVTGHNNGVGGLVGRADPAADYSSLILRGCSATGNVTNTLNESWSNSNTGGLVGRIGSNSSRTETSTLVEYCYATGDVTSVSPSSDPEGNVGGLLGRIRNYVTVLMCYSTGAVNVYENYTEIGGLIGAIDEGFSITSSYYNSETSGMSDTDKGTPKTTAEMADPETYEDWNFFVVWEIGENGYPVIRENWNWEGGIGTELDPYEVWNADDLDGVRSHLTAYYKQMANINLQGIAWTPIGENFEGFYDGNNFTINNLTINETNTWGLGLFHTITGDATLINITLKNVSITSNVGHIGGLVANMYQDARVENCKVEGSVTVVHPSGHNVALLCGNCTGTDGENKGRRGIYSSCAIGTVDIQDPHEWGNAYQGGLLTGVADSTFFRDCYVKGEIKGDCEYLGGITGLSQDTIIERCYALANITGLDYVGGLVGNIWLEGIIEQCYFIGKVNGYYNVGGLIGESYGDTIEVKNCFARGEVNKINDTKSYPTGGFGGLIGDAGNIALVENCYATASVWFGDNSPFTPDPNNSGGLIGVSSVGSIINSYYDSEVSGRSDTGKGVSKTTEEMIYPYVNFPDNVYTDWIFYEDNYDLTEIGPVYSETIDESTRYSPGWYICKVHKDKMYYLWRDTEGYTYGFLVLARSDLSGRNFEIILRDEVGDDFRADIWRFDMDIRGNHIYLIWCCREPGISTVTPYEIWTGRLQLDGSNWNYTRRTYSTTGINYLGDVGVSVGETKVYYFYSKRVNQSGYYLENITELWIATSNLDGSNWQTFVGHSDPEARFNTGDIEVGTNGVYFVFWINHYLPAYTRYNYTARMNLDGSNYSITLADSTNALGYPRLTVHKDKIYYALNGFDSYYYWQVWTAVSDLDGGNWSILERSIPYDKKQMNIDIIIDNEEKIHILWSGWWGSQDDWHSNLWTAISDLEMTEWEEIKQTSLEVGNKMHMDFIGGTGNDGLIYYAWRHYYGDWPMYTTDLYLGYIGGIWKHDKEHKMNDGYPYFCWWIPPPILISTCVPFLFKVPKWV